MERVNILEVFGPREAIKRGFAPVEWAEVKLSPDKFDELNHWATTVTLAESLGSKGSFYTSYSGTTSSRGNVMVEINREDGPKLSLRESLVYWGWNYFLGK